MLIVPYRELQPPTLQALIEEFVTREGAIHGHNDVSLASQVARVTSLLKSGKAVVVFEEAEGTCTIAMKDKLPHDPHGAATEEMF